MVAKKAFSLSVKRMKVYEVNTTKYKIRTDDTGKITTITKKLSKVDNGRTVYHDYERSNLYTETENLPELIAGLMKLEAELHA